MCRACSAEVPTTSRFICSTSAVGKESREASDGHRSPTTTASSLRNSSSTAVAVFLGSSSFSWRGTSAHKVHLHVSATFGIFMKWTEHHLVATSMVPQWPQLIHYYLLDCLGVNYMVIRKTMNVYINSTERMSKTCTYHTLLRYFLQQYSSQLHAKPSPENTKRDRVAELTSISEQLSSSSQQLCDNPFQSCPSHCQAGQDVVPAYTV